MLKRIATAAILLLVLFGFLLGLRQIHVAFVAALICIVACVSSYEICTAFEKAQYKPMKLLVVICSICTSIATYFLGYIGMVLSSILFIFCAFSIFTFIHSFELQDVFSTIIAIVYPIIPLTMLIHLNNLDIGFYALLLVLIVPIMTDTMAYFVGMLIKGPKMCPTISPKKTIAGGIGGIIGGVIGTLIIFLLFDYGNVFSSFKNVSTFSLLDEYWKSILIYIALGLISAPICEIGDLVASWIKRKAEIKDYGNLFLGHGGMMDRMDSIIFMTPIVCVFLEIIKMF